MSDKRETGVSRRAAVSGLGAAGLVVVSSPLRATPVVAQDATPSTDGEIEANKQLVRRFYDAFYGARSTGNVDAIDAFVSPDYLQHEPGVPPGRDGLKQLIRDAGGRSPQPPPLLHLIGEGDIVVAHQIVPGPDPNGPLAAEGVDIFRVADGVLIEHWGVDVAYDVEDEASADGTPAA